MTLIPRRLRAGSRGESLAQILSSTKMVAEGVRTTEAALALSAQHEIELPIEQAMSDVLGGWVMWDDALRDERFVPMDEWLDIYAAYKSRNISKEVG